MIPTTRSGPGLVCRRLATLKADGQFDPVVLQIARFMAPHDILPGLRQRVNLHARSLEMESLLVDLEIADSRVSPAAEDDVQSPEISRMTWSSDSSRPRSKADVLDDIVFSMLSWIESVWQLCVERVDDFKNDDDWQVGHHLLIYIVNVAHSIQKSLQCQSRAIGSHSLKTSTGTTIKTISLNDTDRAVILLAVWVWRDILVTMMANHKMKDHKVISTLTDIRESVQEPYYNELLDVRGLRPLDEFNIPRVIDSIHTACPHWTPAQTSSLTDLRRLYFSQHIANFHILPNTLLYKHITLNSPSSKPALLAHIDSLWSTPAKCTALKDHEIHVIVSYYVTEHMNQHLLDFTHRLDSTNSPLPYNASLLITKEFLNWARYRQYATNLIQVGLLRVRDHLAQTITQITSLSEQDLCDVVQTLKSTTLETRRHLARFTVGMKMGEYRPGNEVDEFLYTRLLSWLDVLEMLCDMAPGTDWKDAVLLEFYTFTGRDGPMKWIVEDGGEDLGDVFVDAFLARTELRGLGMTLKKIIELFAVQKCNEPTRQSDTSRKRTRCDIG